MLLLSGVRRILRDLDPTLSVLRTASIGTCIGWLIAVVVDVHLNHGVLYAPVFLGVPAFLLSVAALASWAPAYRVAKLDPMVALREDGSHSSHQRECGASHGAQHAMGPEENLCSF
jgi:hypothetical protein